MTTQYIKASFHEPVVVLKYAKIKVQQNSLQVSCFLKCG